MKSTGFAPVSALFLLSLTTPQLTAAQSASGSFRFFLEDGLTRLVEFDASTNARGVTVGRMTLIDEARISDVDDVEDPRSDDAPPELFLVAELDGLTVEKNRAVMSGIVKDSSHRTYIGRWVQLVVEDNGDNPREPDRLTWGICRSQERGWIPSDAERERDEGAFLSWWATDAEREDDVGIPSPSLITNEESGCRVYPLSWYTFFDIRKWEGDIIVRP